jgi:allantoate deiminase
MARAGMGVRVDAIGNLRVVRQRPASAGGAPCFYFGFTSTSCRTPARWTACWRGPSVALIEMLGGRKFPFGIEVVGFSDEEGVRFGAPFLGSLALAGSFDAGLLDRTDPAGRTMREAIRSFGLDPNRIPDAQAPPNALGYVEFHIEQGPVLDNLNLPLAVVDVISGQSRADVTFNGRAAHAGTTPMKMRADALAGGAAWIAEVERQALNTPGLVATVGRIDVEPGAGNVVAGRCHLSLDVRHADDTLRQAAAERLAASAREIAEHRGLQVTWGRVSIRPQSLWIPRFRPCSIAAVERAGSPAHRMPSGAGHADDPGIANAGGDVVRAMRGGVSHHPDESVREGDVATALEAGAIFLDELAKARPLTRSFEAASSSGPRVESMRTSASMMAESWRLDPSSPSPARRSTRAVFTCFPGSSTCISTSTSPAAAIGKVRRPAARRSRPAGVRPSSTCRSIPRPAR